MKKDKIHPRYLVPVYTDFTIGDDTFTCHICGEVVEAVVGTEQAFINEHKKHTPTRDKNNLK